MRGKLLLAASVLAGVVAFGALAPTASAHPPQYYSPSYPGYGLHDVVPHWHSYSTPSGTYGYYGNGLHDFVPHNHFYGYIPDYGTCYPAPSYGYGYAPYYPHWHGHHHGW